MIVASLDHFTEYEPYCDVCWKEFNDVRELKFSGHAELCDFHLCSDCRKKLAEALKASL